MTDDARWLDDRESRLWRGWLRSHARLHQAIQRDLRQDPAAAAVLTPPLSESEFEVLVHLTEGPDQGLRMSELARGLHWDRSRTSHQVARMGRRGLVDRAACAEDGRGAVVRATADGHRAIAAAAPGHVVTVRTEFFDRLDETDRADLERILNHLDR